MRAGTLRRVRGPWLHVVAGRPAVAAQWFRRPSSAALSGRRRMVAEHPSSRTCEQLERAEEDGAADRRSARESRRRSPCPKRRVADRASTTPHDERRRDQVATRPATSVATIEATLDAAERRGASRRARRPSPTMYAIVHDQREPLRRRTAGRTRTRSTMLTPFSTTLSRNGVRVSCIDVNAAQRKRYTENADEADRERGERVRGDRRRTGA